MGIRSWLRAKLTDKGEEKLDPTPMAIPVGFERPLTMEQQVARLMRAQYEMQSKIRDMTGVETPEEADDFDIEDDPIDMTTPYEEHFMPDVSPEQQITDDPNFKPVPESGTDSGTESPAKSPAQSSAGEAGTTTT